MPSQSGDQALKGNIIEFVREKLIKTAVRARNNSLFDFFVFQKRWINFRISN